MHFIKKAVFSARPAPQELLPRRLPPSCLAECRYGKNSQKEPGASGCTTGFWYPWFLAARNDLTAIGLRRAHREKCPNKCTSTRTYIHTLEALGKHTLTHTHTRAGSLIYLFWVLSPSGLPLTAEVEYAVTVRRLCSAAIHLWQAHQRPSGGLASKTWELNGTNTGTAAVRWRSGIRRGKKKKKKEALANWCICPKEEKRNLSARTNHKNRQIRQVAESYTPC